MRLNKIMNYDHQTIDGVDIPFSTSWSSIAIGVSGGADSALLAYLLCSLINKPNFIVHIISHTRCWKTKPWQSTDSLNVYTYLVKHFPNITFKRHLNFIAPELEHAVAGDNLIDEYGKQVSGDNMQQRAFAEYICYQYDVDSYYNAVTHNPRGVDFDGMAARDVELSEETEHLAIMEHMGKLACHPFRFVEKSWVVKQYRRLNLVDLFKLTRSCEGTFDNITYKNYIPGQNVPICNECFWCKEREWAIEQSK